MNTGVVNTNIVNISRVICMTQLECVADRNVLKLLLSSLSKYKNIDSDRAKTNIVDIKLVMIY